MATTVTSKGQVTIPKSVRDLLGIVPGTAVDFDLTPDGQVVLRKTSQGRPRVRSPRSRFAPLRGVATVKMTTDEILALTRGD
jgi:AbrB family looped-hinge helix DNA binding protein